MRNVVAVVGNPIPARGRRKSTRLLGALPSSLRYLFAVLLALTFMPARADIAVVEYYHAAFDHYFVTGIPDEITKLDNGTFAGWARTGKQFDVYASGTAGSAATCRFFGTSFGEKSSHFYTSDTSECTTVKSNPNWQFEGEVFNVAVPAADGTCPASTRPIYRLYNNGQGGAPNHRFVTSLADRQAMIDKGFVAEGAGIGIGMCAPSPVGNRTTAEGLWKGVTDRGQSLRILVLIDGTFHIVFSQKGNEIEAGVLYGSGSSTGGQFMSTDVKEYPLSPSAQPFDGGAVAINGKYVPGVSMQLTIGSSTVSATYDPAYDLPANLATLAGSYTGSSGHVTEQRPMTAQMDAKGNLLISGVQCQIQVTATPRGTVNVFDITVSSGSCYVGPGIMIYDEPSRTLLALSPSFFNGLLQIPDLWYAIAKRQ